GGRMVLATLAACIADESRLLVLQQRCVEDRRAAAELLREGRRALRNAARAVVKFGRVVDLDETTMKTMRVPKSMSDDELFACMGALIDRVSAHQGAFVAKGLPPELLSRMADQVRRFLNAKGALASARQQFTAAAVSMRETQAT